MSVRVCVCVWHIFFIHSRADGPLHDFHILPIVRNAAMNIGVHISFQIVSSFSTDIYPRMELLDHMVFLFLVFWGTSIVFSIVAAPIYIPTNSILGFSFLHILANLLFLVLLTVVILTGVR